MKLAPETQLLSLKIASYLTLDLLFTLPLIFVPRFISYSVLRYFVFGTVSLILALTTTLLWLRMAWIPKLLFRKWYGFGLIAYLATFLVVSFTSVDKASSFFSSFQSTDGAFTMIFMGIFCLNIFTLLVLKNKAYFYRLLGASVLGASILSILIMFFTYNTVGTWFEGSRGGATVGNSSLAAAYILWNIFFAIILILKSSGPYKYVWGFVTLVLLTSPLFINWHTHLSNGITDLIGAARGATIGIIFGVAISVSLWLMWQESKIKKNLGFAGLIILAGGFIFAGFELLANSGQLHQAFASVAGESRFIFWNIALKAFKIHPIVGWGPSTFNIPFHTFYDPKMAAIPGGEIWVNKAHNIIFETLENGGILLFLGLIFFLTTIIVGIIKAKKQGNISILEAGLLLGALLGWFLQAQFVFESIVSFTMLFLVAGVAYVFSIKNIGEAEKNIYRLTNLKKLLFGSLTAASLGLFLFTIISPFNKAKALYNTFSAPLPARTAKWQNLASGSAMGNGFDSILFLNNLRAVYSNEIEMLQQDPKMRNNVTNDIDAVISYINDLTKGKPYTYEFALIRAKLYFLRLQISKTADQAEIDQAATYANKTIELSPTNPESYWIAAKVQFAAKNYPETKKLLEQAYALEPKALETNQFILNFAKLTKDDAYYKSSLEKAKKAIPSFQE